MRDFVLCTAMIDTMAITYPEISAFPRLVSAVLLSSKVIWLICNRAML